jgi:hypothetical protein
MTDDQQDVINLGRIIGVPTLCGTEGQEFERSGARDLNRAKRALTSEDKQEIRFAHQRMLFGEENVQTPSAAEAIRKVQVEIVKNIQSQFNGSIIRRTINSKRPDGTALNDQLPPYVSHVLPVELEDWEMEVLNDSFQDIIQNKRNSTLLEFSNEVSLPWQAGGRCLTADAELLYLLSIESGVP